MITRIAVVPYPPLLVPELTVRSVAETEQLRTSCLYAVSSLTDTARGWVAVGVDRYGPRLLGPDAVGTFAGYGVDVPVALGAGAEGVPDPQLPLPALIAGWLRAQAGASEVTAHLLAADMPTAECRAYGARLAASVERVGLLVLADGTQCRDIRSPRPPDERAAPADEQIKTALAEADTARLLGMDPALSTELGLEGRAALQTLAGAAESEGCEWTGELVYAETPFGVTYHVAVWSRPDV